MRRISFISLTLAASVSIVGPAHATFILDASCGQSQCADGTKFFIDVANSDVPTFTGKVGIGGPSVTVDTKGNVDTGSGFATIKPTKDATLTDLIFAPADDTLFTDFSFRGQLEKEGFTGEIDVVWTDSIGITGEITFTVDKPDQDFNRLGIVSDDGETLKSVEITTPSDESFKEFKQVEFSFATPPPIPEPAPITLIGGALVLFGIMWRRRSS